MLRIIIHIIILLVFVQPVLAGHLESVEFETLLIERINNARNNPLETAKSFGMNPDAILADFPELHDMLISGLPILYPNAKLTSAARFHTSDMFGQNYYGHISPDGSTPEERILLSGYVPGLSSESLGILAFKNFINPVDAVNRIFENMFRDELNPLISEKRNILDPNLKEIGVGFGAGPLKIGSALYNAYVATCNFGSRGYPQYDIDAGEELLNQLINQFRENPLEIAAKFGFNPDEILSENPGIKDILINGLPQLQVNLRLSEAADINNLRTLGRIAVDESLNESEELYNRFVNCGYIPMVQAEFSASIPFEQSVELETAVAQLFIQLLNAEFDAGTTGKLYVLNPDFEEIGIAIGCGGLLQDGYLKDAFVVTCDFGVSAISKEENELLLLINYARTQPLEYAKSIGVDVEQLYIDNPEYYDVLDKGFSPLAFNSRLYFAAKAHLIDMHENGYFDHTSLDGRSFENRINENGYDFSFADELLGLSFCNYGFERIFETLFIEEIMSIGASDKKILNPELQDCGLAYLNAKADKLRGLCSDYINLLVIDFGIPDTKS